MFPFEIFCDFMSFYVGMVAKLTKTFKKDHLDFCCKEGDRLIAENSSDYGEVTKTLKDRVIMYNAERNINEDLR